MNKIKLFLTLTFFALLFSSCEALFQDKVPMPRGSKNATLYQLVASSKERGQLETPSQIFVSLCEYSDKIKINWSPVVNAYSYRLERAIVTEKDENGNFVEPDESEFEVLEHAKALIATSYVDTVIKDDGNDPLDYTNQKYGYAFFYRVSAENSFEGYDSSEFKTSTQATLLAPPSNVKASMGASETLITLSWKETAGALRYEIFRGQVSDGTGSSRIGQVNGNRNTKFENPIDATLQGEELYYTVVAISATGARSVNSSIALGYTLKEGAPPAVTGVKITSGRGDDKDGISISWDNVGAEKYTVYRSSSVDSSMEKRGDATGTSFKDTKGLKPNVYYYYYVQASKTVNGENIRGPMSDSGPEAGANAAEGFILSPPESIEITKVKTDSGSSTCNIKFSAVIGDDSYIAKSGLKDENKEYQYVILGCDTENGDFEEVRTFDNTSIHEPDGYYKVAGVQIRNYYKIKVKNKAGKESALSALAAPSPFAAREVYVTRAAAVEGWTNSDIKANNDGVHAVKITWKAPEGGAEAYHVYRANKWDSGTKGFKKITDNPVTDLSYIDFNETAKAGTIYYYKVCALNSLFQGTNYSDCDQPKVENRFIKIKNDDGTPYGRGFGWGALTTYQWVREYINTTLGSQDKLTLMHKKPDTAKLGSETIRGDISGTLSYNAKTQGIGARIVMHYADYADFYVMNDKNLGIYFHLEGDTNTSASMDASGTMDGIVVVKGMYPGSIDYGNIKIKGGGAGGGTYDVIRDGIDSVRIKADWNWGEKNFKK